MSEPKNVWDLHCELGEGPVWVDGALWFVDIKKQKIYRYEPSNGGRREWDTPEQVGFILPADDGSFVAGLQSGLYRFDPESGGFDRIARVLLRAFLVNTDNFRGSRRIQRFKLRRGFAPLTCDEQIVFAAQFGPHFPERGAHCRHVLRKVEIGVRFIDKSGHARSSKLFSATFAMM